MARSLFAGEVAIQGRPPTLMSLCGKTSIRELMISTSWKTWFRVEQRRRGNGSQRGRVPQMLFMILPRKVARIQGARNERHGSQQTTLARRKNHALQASQ